MQDLAAKRRRSNVTFEDQPAGPSGTKKPNNPLHADSDEAVSPELADKEGTPSAVDAVVVESLVSPFDHNALCPWSLLRVSFSHMLLYVTLIFTCDTFNR